MSGHPIQQVRHAVAKFTAWLDDFGETSYDHQSYYAGPWGGRAKALYYKKPMAGIAAVAPMVASEAFLPAARRLFWKPQRLPIADAHYAMGFAFLVQVSENTSFYGRAVHFARVLEQTRCPGYANFCWGYPFNWVTKGGAIAEGTPLITTTPYAWEAFLQLYRLDRSERWHKILRSIAEHVHADYRDVEMFPGAYSCGYTPLDQTAGVVNASAYRAFVLTGAAKLFPSAGFSRKAEGNLNLVIRAQKPDGSWPYAIGNGNTFVDHFHTCFVLKALAKIEGMTGCDNCRRAITAGVDYYVRELFDARGLPKPFARAPRFTVYRRELYDYAECINLGMLLKGRFPALDRRVERAVQDILARWQKPDGSFRSRQLFIGWDSVPMHRWAQSQLFRSLCFLLHEEHRAAENNEQTGESHVRYLRAV